MFPLPFQVETMARPLPDLTVIPGPGRAKVVRPPGKLGKTGMSLWRDITEAYQFGDRSAYEALYQACCALDRLAQIRERLDTDGPMIETAQGGFRAHPLLRDELGYRAFVVRTLGKLGCDLEPVLAVGRPPGR
jgi:hypothetical protein